MRAGLDLEAVQSSLHLRPSKQFILIHNIDLSTQKVLQEGSTNLLQWPGLKTKSGKLVRNFLKQTLSLL